MNLYFMKDQLLQQEATMVTFLMVFQALLADIRAKEVLMYRENAGYAS